MFHNIWEFIVCFVNGTFNQAIHNFITHGIHHAHQAHHYGWERCLKPLNWLFPVHHNPNVMHPDHNGVYHVNNNHHKERIHFVLTEFIRAFLLIGIVAIVVSLLFNVLTIGLIILAIIILIGIIALLL